MLFRSALRQLSAALPPAVAWGNGAAGADEISAPTDASTTATMAESRNMRWLAAL